MLSNSYPVIVRWRARPALVAMLLSLGVAAITGLLVASGGPPSPVTHLYYVAVVVAAVLWGSTWGAAAGALCGVLADPWPAHCSPRRSRRSTAGTCAPRS